MAQQIPIYQATVENFNQLVLENSSKGPVLVHFWAAWVGPGMMLKPLFEKQVNDYAGRFLLLLMEDEVETAMDQLMNMLKLDRWYGDELARHSLLALFNMLGEDHELVKKYRLRLFDALGN